MCCRGDTDGSRSNADTVKPTDRLAPVARPRAEDRVVALAGDGTNDPLAQVRAMTMILPSASEVANALRPRVTNRQ